MLLLEDVAEAVLKYADKKRKTWFTSDEFVMWFRRVYNYGGSYFTVYNKLEALARKGLLRKVKTYSESILGLRVFRSVYYVNRHNLKYWLKERGRNG